MEYTLDSVTHAKEALKNLLKCKKIEAYPKVCFLKELENQKDNVYFFGVISIGSNFSYAVPRFHGLDMLKLDTDSQIILLFDELYINNKLDAPNTTKGFFRGFQLITSEHNYIKEEIFTSPE